MQVEFYPRKLASFSLSHFSVETATSNRRTPPHPPLAPRAAHMTNRRLAIVPTLVSLATGTAGAFVVPNGASRGARRTPSVLSMSLSDGTRTGAATERFGAALGAFGLAAALLTSGPGPASASASTSSAGIVELAPSLPPPAAAEAFQSSTLHLSEQIRTMDFSMPSSYDSISDIKTNSVDELSKTTEVRPSRPNKKAAEPKQKMPAMTAEERVAYKKEMEAKRDQIAAEKAAEQKEIAAEKAAEAKARAEQTARDREAAAAAKAEKEDAAKVEKEAAAAAKAEKQNLEVLKGAEFIDTGMPSYSGSTSGTKKSAFSL